MRKLHIVQRAAFSYVQHSGVCWTTGRVAGGRMSQGRARYRDYVSFRLERVASMVRAEASKIYQERCGLDIRQLRVLRSAAERPGSSVSEIVEATMFERTLVSRLIS